MNCPICLHPDSKVVDTRASGDGIRRRRACMACGYRFTTFERVEQRLPLVVKNDGLREPFSRDKILAGLRLACRKRPVPAEALEEAATQVEQACMTAGAEVSSAEIGRRVMLVLKDLDNVAYLRFASVYLDVQTPSEFQALIEPWLRADAEGVHRGDAPGAAGWEPDRGGEE